jgi:hypothetical protein
MLIELDDDNTTNKNTNGDYNRLPNEEGLVLVAQNPVTSSLSGTLKHLRQRADCGWFTRFRGLSLYAVNGFVNFQLVRLFSVFLPVGLGNVLASILTVQLSMGWVHIVISEQSKKYWWKRLPSIQAWKKIIGPIAIFSILETFGQLVYFALLKMSGVGAFTNPQEFNGLDAATKARMAGAVSLISFGFIAYSIVVVIPSFIMITRIKASLLSEEEVPIIPFDQTFGGKVIPTELGGTGVLGIFDSWTTFDWNSRVRVLKVFLKVLAIETASIFLFIGVIVGEVWLFLDPEIKQAAQNAWATRHDSAQN